MLLMKLITFSAAISDRCCRCVFLHCFVAEAGGVRADAVGVLVSVCFRFFEARGETGTSRTEVGDVLGSGGDAIDSWGKNLGWCLWGGWPNEKTLALSRPRAARIVSALASAGFTYW
jgi:hypothetical protein